MSSWRNKFIKQTTKLCHCQQTACCFGRKMRDFEADFNIFIQRSFSIERSDQTGYKEIIKLVWKLIQIGCKNPSVLGWMTDDIYLPGRIPMAWPLPFATKEKRNKNVRWEIITHRELKLLENFPQETVTCKDHAHATCTGKSGQKLVELC